LDLLNECEQLLTANNSLVSKLPLVLYRGPKALARFVMSLRVTEGIHGLKWLRIWTVDVLSGPQQWKLRVK
jgi:hypothetical protein